jgi:RNA recognition motif-containing protein
MKNKPSTTVYISNLSYKRDRNGLRSLFSRYGTIKSIKIIVEPETNQSRGMAFVEMESLIEAAKAIEGLNGKVIDGRTVKANYAIPQKPEAVKKTVKTEKTEKKPLKDKSLDFKSVQLAKKARNDERRKANKFIFKAPTKKVKSKK